MRLHPFLDTVSRSKGKHVVNSTRYRPGTRLDGEEKSAGRGTPIFDRDRLSLKTRKLTDNPYEESVWDTLFQYVLQRLTREDKKYWCRRRGYVKYCCAQQFLLVYDVGKMCVKALLSLLKREAKPRHTTFQQVMSLEIFCIYTN